MLPHPLDADAGAAAEYRQYAEVSGAFFWGSLGVLKSMNLKSPSPCSNVQVEYRPPMRQC
jgi:hypothetical protein